MNSDSWPQNAGLLGLLPALWLLFQLLVCC